MARRERVGPGAPLDPRSEAPRMTDARTCRGCRFPAEVILWAVRRYLRFPISYRDLERRLADRGVAVDHFYLRRRLPTRARSGKKPPLPTGTAAPLLGFRKL